MLDTVRADISAVLTHDPAARSALEVVLCYPGLHALMAHRCIHCMWHYESLKLVARILSQIMRFLTGIEIHPGATIGRGICIDHGMGIVIGETAIVGDGVVLFQGVTLGGIGKQRGKRHPTIGASVVIGANASVLGPITVGAHAKVGAHALVLHDVPPGATVVGMPPNQRVIVR